MGYCILKKDDGIYTLKLGGKIGKDYLTNEAMKNIEDALKSVGEDPRTRGLVTTSKYGSFCDGVNYENQEGGQAEDLAQRMAKLVELLLKLSIPTVAALRGDATSLGLVLALAHDHCVVCKDAVLSFPESGIGHPLPDYAVALVHDKIASARLRKLLVLDSKRCTGAEVANMWSAAKAVSGSRNQLVIQEATNLIHLQYKRGVDYAEERRMLHTQTCAVMRITTQTGHRPRRRPLWVASEVVAALAQPRAILLRFLQREKYPHRRNAKGVSQAYKVA